MIPDNCVLKLHFSEQCQQEIDRVLEGKTEFTFNDRNQMPYMQVNKDTYLLLQTGPSRIEGKTLVSISSKSQISWRIVLTSGDNVFFHLFTKMFYLSLSRLLFMRRRGWPTPFHSASSTVQLTTQSLTVIPFPK